MPQQRRPNAFDGMMAEFCVKYGFCSVVSGGIANYLPLAGAVTAEQFVTWAIIAEGLEAEVAPFSMHQTDLQIVFRKHLGDSVDAEWLYKAATNGKWPMG